MSAEELIGRCMHCGREVPQGAERCLHITFECLALGAQATAASLGGLVGQVVLDVEVMAHRAGSYLDEVGAICIAIRRTSG